MDACFFFARFSGRFDVSKIGYVRSLGDCYDFPPDISLVAMMIMPANHLLFEFGVYFVFAFVFSRQAVPQGFLTPRRLFNSNAVIAMATLALHMPYGG